MFGCRTNHVVVSFQAVVGRVFGKRVEKMRQQSRHRSSNHQRTTNGVTTAAAAAATAAAVDESPNPHIVHPVAVRTKIPLKRKVREKEGKKNRTGKSGHKTYASNAISSLLRRPMRHNRKQHRRPPRDPAERQRRSGVVSTKEKVRSWLERENPTQEVVDSDNESQFPEEEQTSKENGSPSTTTAAVATKRRHSVDAKVLSSRNSQSNLTAALDPHKESSSKERKMMRSISETTKEWNGRHNFSRSISQGNEPDFRGLNRKTESHSHLLSSKSELDIVEANKPLDLKDEGLAEVHSSGEKVTHPAVQKRIPKISSSAGLLPKSATESHLVVKALDRHQQANHKKRFSTDFLNLLMSGKTSTSAPQADSGASNNKKKRISRSGEEVPAAAVPNGGSGHNNKNVTEEKKKKIGLGPVRVVLKWHGAVRMSAGNPKRTTGGKSPKKKRVIVYKNGNPTAPLCSSSPSQKPDHPEVREDPSSSKKETVVNITENPLDAALETVAKRHSPMDKMVRSTSNGEAEIRSPRRSSMQERQPPPALMRRVSEIHHPPTVMLNNNQRRNRHSWTSSCAPEPLPDSTASHIGIRIDDDVDC